MSGYVVKYEFQIVVESVLAFREAFLRPAQICKKFKITPEILQFWCQQYARSSTELLRRLVEIYNPKVTDRKDVIEMTVI